MEKQVADDLWVVPNALQELAEIAYFSGDIDAAERLLQRGSAYSGFVFAFF